MAWMAGSSPAMTERNWLRQRSRDLDPPPFTGEVSAKPTEGAAISPHTGNIRRRYSHPKNLPYHHPILAR
jgi:hypothetical protein